MAYNERVVERVREVLADQPLVVEKKMFGGLSFILQGNMCCGVINHDLVVRVGPDGHEDALAQPHARPMDFTGRPMKGMVYVGPEGYQSPEDLKGWVQRGLKFAQSLPRSKEMHYQSVNA